MHGIVSQIAPPGVAPKPEFAPDDITGLALWLDASDSDTVTLSGTAVTGWDSKVGSASFLQGTSARRPAYVTNEVNGNAVIRFDDDILVGNNAARDVWRGLTGATTFTVVRATDRTATGRAWFINIATTPLGTNRASMMLSGSEVVWRLRRLDNDSETTLRADAPANDAVVIWTGDVNYGTKRARLWLNAALEVDDDDAVSTGSTADSRAAAFGIGARSNPDQWWGGDIMEILIYTRVLSDADRDAVHAYLANKWGITLA
jgi:hypothetical protein